MGSGAAARHRDQHEGAMKNIAFLITPKNEVVWVSASGTLGEAIERMKPNGFAAVPLLDEDGGYVGTLTEGDILWYLLDGPERKRACEASVLDVLRRTNNRAVHINAKLETLVLRAAEQNFVPVLDDREVFIGIVRRKSIIEQCLPSASARKSGADSKLRAHHGEEFKPPSAAARYEAAGRSAFSVWAASRSARIGPGGSGAVRR
jgi:CBS domain-containing protein